MAATGYDAAGGSHMPTRPRARLAGLVLAAVPLLAGAAQWPRMTGDSPLHRDALPPARIAAIVDEARRVAAVPHPDTPVTPLPAHWQTLDPDTLATLLRMPDWETVVQSDRTDGVLLQQAAAWDLLDFHRPSDLARLWGHVWPESLRPTPDSAPFSFGAAYEPDPSWAPLPRAMAALLQCLPHEAWTAAGDPLVEANRQPWAWAWGGGYTDPDGFRPCVERTARFVEIDGGYGPPHDPPDVVPRVVDVLKDRLAAALHVDGCSRSGPDSCLLLLEALAALDPNDARLPGLVRRLEPGFALDAPIDVPDVAAPDTTGAQDVDARAALAVPETEALRRLAFLQTKTRLLLHRPENWPAGELDRTVAQGTRAGLALGLAWSRMSWRAPHHLRRDVDVRPLLAAPVEHHLARSQQALGQTIASEHACRYADLPTDIIDPFAGTRDFWSAYLDANRRAGHPCR